jgi:hypothetical protein
MVDEADPVFGLIARRLLRGKVVPVLGAGVNLCGRPPDASYVRGQYLPSARELAGMLAAHYPIIDSQDLAQVAQYISALEGEGPLYEELHDVFDADYPCTVLHHFLARLSHHTRTAEDSRGGMLFVTTNYDDLLEQAFREADEPFELVTYIAEGNDRGCFRHVSAEGRSTVIRVPNEYSALGLEERPVIIKLHGAVDRQHQLDSYVITEDHYIDYLTRADVGGLFPIKLAAKLRASHFLFLGYSLRDWNLRVMLYRMWGEQEGRTYKSWAVQADPSPIDLAAWDERGIEILHLKVEHFVAAIERHLFGEPAEVS